MLASAEGRTEIVLRQSPFSLFNAAQFLRRVAVFPLTNNVLTTLGLKTPQCLATVRLSSSMCTFASKNRPFGASMQKVKKTRIAGLCGREVGACVHLPLSCFFFHPSYSLETRNQLFQRKLAFRQLRPQRPHTAFQVLDGKGCHPSRKNGTQRPTGG